MVFDNPKDAGRSRVEVDKTTTGSAFFYGPLPLLLLEEEATVPKECIIQVSKMFGLNIHCGRHIHVVIYLPRRMVCFLFKIETGNFTLPSWNFVVVTVSCVFTL